MAEKLINSVNSFETLLTPVEIYANNLSSLLYTARNMNILSE